MKWKNKNVLITGAAGFVGSYLAEELLDRDANVYGLIRGRADSAMSKNLLDRGISGTIKSINGNITDITSLLNALDESKPDYIFHLAAQSSDQDHLKIHWKHSK